MLEISQSSFPNEQGKKRRMKKNQKTMRRFSKKQKKSCCHGDIDSIDAVVLPQPYEIVSFWNRPNVARWWKFNREDITQIKKLVTQQQMVGGCVPLVPPGIYSIIAHKLFCACFISESLSISDDEWEVYFYLNLTFKCKGHAKLFYFVFHNIALTFYTQFFKWATKKSFPNE